jgi:hypothetical protein
MEHALGPRRHPHAIGDPVSVSGDPLAVDVTDFVPVAMVAPRAKTDTNTDVAAAVESEADLDVSGVSGGSHSSDGGSEEDGFQHRSCPFTALYLNRRANPKCRNQAGWGVSSVL